MALQQKLRSQMTTYEDETKAKLSRCDGQFTNELIKIANGCNVEMAAANGHSKYVILTRYLNIPDYCMTSAVITKPQKPIDGVKVTTETRLIQGNSARDVPITFSW